MIALGEKMLHEMRMSREAEVQALSARGSHRMFVTDVLIRRCKETHDHMFSWANQLWRVWTLYSNHSQFDISILV